ncbi:hypothetical protein GW844_02280 [bacterium]|nr:hypothetical protein [bacterium]
MVANNPIPVAAHKTAEAKRIHLMRPNHDVMVQITVITAKNPTIPTAMFIILLLRRSSFQRIYSDPIIPHLPRNTTKYNHISG